MYSLFPRGWRILSTEGEALGAAKPRRIESSKIRGGQRQAVEPRSEGGGRGKESYKIQGRPRGSAASQGQGELPDSEGVWAGCSADTGGRPGQGTHEILGGEAGAGRPRRGGQGGEPQVGRGGPRAPGIPGLPGPGEGAAPGPGPMGPIYESNMKIIC